jgi:hypothetical protein
VTTKMITVEVDVVRKLARDYLTTGAEIMRLINEVGESVCGDPLFAKPLPPGVVDLAAERARRRP